MGGFGGKYGSESVICIFCSHSPVDESFLHFRYHNPLKVDFVKIRANESISDRVLEWFVGGVSDGVV